MLHVLYDKSVGFHQMLEGCQRVVKDPIEIEALELNESQNVSDIFDLDDEAPVGGHEIPCDFKKVMWIFEMSEHATSDDDIRPPVFDVDLPGAPLIEEAAQRR